MASQKITIGYILSLSMAENVFMGGVMVTDVCGLPLEFRYTEPVRATKLQRVLYGDVLEKYIHCDVIAANLVNRLDLKPDLLVVSDPALLTSLESGGRGAVMLLAAHVPPLKEYGAMQEAGEGEFFLQLTNSGSPVRVRLAPHGTPIDPAHKSEAARILVEAARTMDIIEPQARVETAVRMLWAEAPETPMA